MISGAFSCSDRLMQLWSDVFIGSKQIRDQKTRVLSTRRPLMEDGLACIMYCKLISFLHKDEATSSAILYNSLLEIKRRLPV